MSALVKKRNYTDTLGDNWPANLTTLPHKLHQLNIDKPNTRTKSIMQKNLEELKSLFQGIDEKVTLRGSPAPLLTVANRN